MAGAGAERSVGPLQVVADRASVAAFAAALGGDAVAGAVPYTYPICWLDRREIVAAARALDSRQDATLVHEQQTFAYRRPIRLDEPYRVMLRITAPPGRLKRLLVDATVTDGDGETVMEMRAGLIVVSGAAKLAAEKAK